MLFLETAASLNNTSNSLLVKDVINDMTNAVSVTMGSCMLLVGTISILLALVAIKTHRPATSKFLAGLMALVFGPFLMLHKSHNLINNNSVSNAPKPKPFVFTTLDWQILVGLVLATLILVVIIYWILLKHDNRPSLIKGLFYTSILGNALFGIVLAIGKNVSNSTLDSKTSFIAFSIVLALIILTLMLKEFYRVQKYHQAQIYGIYLHSIKS